MMDKIPVTPNMLHAQRTSTPNSVINGISTRTQKLIQKKEREGVHSALIQNRGKSFQPTVVMIYTYEVATYEVDTYDLYRIIRYEVAGNIVTRLKCCTFTCFENKNSLKDPF